MALEDVPVATKAQAPLEAPSTPSSLRRRRKFPSVGANGAESGIGEGGGEPYRSLSDPMPHRRCPVAEEAKNFSVDSNLLGSLSAKGGIPQPAAMALAGSAGSDLSLGSDGLRDYSSLIQTIVSQPGAMDKVIDEKGNGKTIKKKSLSDPSRRGELAAGAFEGPGEAISELEGSIPPSSSEPILSEQRSPPARPQGHQGYGFDPKLAEVLSPRGARRSSKKRSSRASHQENQPPPVPPGLSRVARPATKHVRHTSEPATFVPISVPEPHAAHHAHLPVPDATRLPLKTFPAPQPPSLEDVTKRYMLALNSGDTSPGPGDGPRSSPATPTAPEPARCPRQSDPRSKPQVVSALLAPKPRGLALWDCPPTGGGGVLGSPPHRVALLGTKVFPLALLDGPEQGPALSGAEGGPCGIHPQK